MSNEAVSKPRTRRSPAEGTSTAAERPAAEVSETTKKPVVPKEIDPNQIITVRNGFQGRLVYKSKRTGERWSWESFGAEQDMELSELKNARNSNKKYFINNWFMFDEDWVIDYLGMRQYYKNSLNIQDFDSCSRNPLARLRILFPSSRRDSGSLWRIAPSSLSQRRKSIQTG